MSVILIIEDDEQVRVLAESVLRDAGYEVLAATAQEGARALLNSDQSIDLLFRTYPFWQGTNPRPFQSGPSTPSIQSAVAMASATMRPPPSHIATLSGRGYGAVTSQPVLGGLHHQYCRI